MNNWHVYLLLCSDGSYYCGIAQNVAARIAQHNGERPGGARYTRSRRPVSLLGCVGNMNKSEALSLEAKIKKLPRRAKTAAFIQPEAD